MEEGAEIAARIAALRLADHTGASPLAAAPGAASASTPATAPAGA
jgi:hypothetical protein